MKSLVILMIEAEQPEGLSARKLVVETAKHNVLTAYNPESGLNLLHRFPNVDMVLVHESLLVGNIGYLAEVKELGGGIPIIVASPFKSFSSPEADYVVDSHIPQQLLELLQNEFQADSGN